MKVSDFFETDELITDALVAEYDFLTEDAQKVINGVIKYDFFNRKFYYNEATDIHDVVEITLARNAFLYDATYNTLTQNIPLSFMRRLTRTKEGSDALVQTGTQTNTDEHGKRVELTPSDVLVTDSPSDTRQTRTLANSEIAESGTVTDTTTEKEKPFDGNAYVDVRQTENVNTPSNRKSETTYKNNEVILDETVVDGTVHTEYENHQIEQASGTDTHRQTNNLRDETFYDTEEIETEESPDIIVRLEEYKKLLEDNLWNRIIDDLKSKLFAVVWEEDECCVF